MTLELSPPQPSPERGGGPSQRTGEDEGSLFFLLLCPNFLSRFFVSILGPDQTKIGTEHFEEGNRPGKLSKWAV